MIRKPLSILLVFVSILAAASLACRSVRVTEVKTGPTQTEDIQVDLPDTNRATDVEIRFGAGELSIEPGEDALISGTATYNVDEFKPVVTSRSGNVVLTQDSLDTQGFPNVQGNLKNEWELQFGEAPITLDIKAGAYEGRYELGDLAIEKLTIQDGASDVNVSFSKPNLTEMRLLRYETGASDVTLEGLANANFEEMEFRSGAGSYTLDFTGDLKRDAEVTIESGISSVTIIVPEGMNAEVTFDGGLSNVSTSGDWDEINGQYVQKGKGPTLYITVKMGAGDLKLENP